MNPQFWHKRKEHTAFDEPLKTEVQLSIENDYPTYQKESSLFGNYQRKIKKGKFDFRKAEKGELNLIVTPFARKYQHEWGVKVGTPERKAIAKARVRYFWRDLVLNK
jgi:hypothetical protein